MGDMLYDVGTDRRCTQCRELMQDGEEPGYPRTCPECPAEEDEDNDNG